MPPSASTLHPSTSPCIPQCFIKFTSSVNRPRNVTDLKARKYQCSHPVWWPRESGTGLPAGQCSPLAASEGKVSPGPSSRIPENAAVLKSVLKTPCAARAVPVALPQSAGGATCRRNTRCEHPQAAAAPHRSPLTPRDVAAQAGAGGCGSGPATLRTQPGPGSTVPLGARPVSPLQGTRSIAGWLRGGEACLEHTHGLSSAALNRRLSNICCRSLQVPSRSSLSPFTALAVSHGDAETRTRAAPAYTRPREAAVPPRPPPALQVK